MPRDWGRGIGALVVLGALWVLVYWLWEPSRPRIVFDETPGMRDRTSLGGGEGPPAARAGAKPVTPVVTQTGANSPPRPQPTAAPTGSSAPAPPPKLAVVPPTFRTYTVKKGDTWESIAAKEMGSRDLWQDLTRANPLMTELKTGRQIRVPADPGNIQGRPVAEAPTGAQPAPVVEYTVKGGDTLGGIAKAYYGSTSYKDLIFQANRDTLEQEDQLKIGQRLKLPPKPN